MKKFFGLTVLLAAVIFSSCNFNGFYKKGSVDFAIPIGEILAYKNEISEAENPIIQDEPETLTNLGAIVQIKGDKGYYKALLKKTDIQDYKDNLYEQWSTEYWELNDQIQELREAAEQDWDKISELQKRLEEISEKEHNFYKTDDFYNDPRISLNYCFEDLPVDQNYKIMVDIFEEYKSLIDEGQDYTKHLFTGDKSDITVFTGETTHVDLEVNYIDEDDYTSLDMILVSNDVSDRIELDDSKDILSFYIGYCTEEEKYYYRLLDDNKYYGQYYDYELPEQNRSEWKELTDLQIIPKDSFLNFDFTTYRKVSENNETGEIVYEPYSLDFSKGPYSIMEHLTSYNLDFDNLALIISKNIQGETISFAESLPFVYVKSFVFNEADSKSGSFSVSVPISIDSEGYADIDPDSTVIFHYLVQLRGEGDNKYTAAQLRTVSLDDIESVQTFDFSGVPYRQNYDVMVDIFTETMQISTGQSWGHSLLVCSGDSNVLVDINNTSTSVGIREASEHTYSNFDMILDYINNDGETTLVQEFLDTPDDIPMVFACYEEGSGESTEYKYYFRERKASDGDDNVFKFEDQNPEDWYELTGIRFDLKGSSHFWNTGFEFLYAISTDEEISFVSLPFSDTGACDVISYINGIRNPFGLPLEAVKKFDNTQFEASILAPQLYFADITFAEKQEPVEETFTETDSGEIEIEESKLIFEPWNVQENSSSVRYMTTVPLDDILNGKHLSDGDTAVFVLTTDGQSSVDNFSTYGVSQFYYQLQPDDWQTIYEDDDEGLFANNNCINFDVRDSGDYTFVMPLNQIEDAVDYNNLQIFFDTPKGTDAESLELDCSIKYSIFPAVEKAFVFGVGKNWGKSDSNPSDYRYEVNTPLKDIYGNALDLAEGDTVKVYLQGKIRSYTADGFANLSSNTIFSAELYDNAEYDGSSFHALSIDMLDEKNENPNNRKTISMGSDGGLANYGEFVFSPIAAPYVSKDDVNFKNDFRFQCHTPCVSPSTLLVITDYSLTTEVTH